MWLFFNFSLALTILLIVTRIVWHFTNGWQLNRLGWMKKTHKNQNDSAYKPAVYYIKENAKRASEAGLASQPKALSCVSNSEPL